MSFNDFQSVLEQNNKTFKDSEISSFEDLPDGIFEVKIIDYKFGHSKKTQKWQLSVTFRVEGPTHQGRQIFNYYGLEDPNGLKFLKWLLSYIDLPTDDLTKIEDIALEFKGKELDMQVMTKNGSKRYYPKKKADPSLNYNLENKEIF